MLTQQFSRAELATPMMEENLVLDGTLVGPKCTSVDPYRPDRKVWAQIFSRQVPDNK
jgi:hypothetical protein